MEPGPDPRVNDNDPAHNNNKGRVHLHLPSQSLPSIPSHSPSSESETIITTYSEFRLSDRPLAASPSSHSPTYMNNENADPVAETEDTRSQFVRRCSKESIHNGFKVLETNLNVIVKGHHNLTELQVYSATVEVNEAEKAVVDPRRKSTTPSTDGTVYFDAMESPEPESAPEYTADYDNVNQRLSRRKKLIPTKAKKRGKGGGGASGSGAGSEGSLGSVGGSDTDVGCYGMSKTTSKAHPTPTPSVALVKVFKKGAERRKRIPDRPNQSMSLWSILKNSLGKDLTKISMPVNFSEPLSMLQRLTEDYEYSDILDTAARCTDNYLQLCHVAAFTVSSYASTAVRTAKPFNPLLGETYECDRKEDRGWRCISEQVSHHPPTAALYCEGDGWICWQDFTMSTKFRGNSLEIVPLGMAHLTFTATGNHYTWRKVTTVVHNIVLGKLWVDQVGDMVIKNHKTGDTCNLKYNPTTFFGKHPKQVIGNVMSRGTVKWNLIGTWNEKFQATPFKSDKVSDSKSQKSLTAGTLTLWTIKLPSHGSEKYYDFGEFACQLNEPEEGVAPTDSRLRPDQRLMEDGRWEEANIEKCRLEDKQRSAKKKREAESEKPSTAAVLPHDSYEPLWFRKDFDPITATSMYKYTEEYWDCKKKKDWKQCNNIFGS